jgi:hypothetical protein
MGANIISDPRVAGAEDGSHALLCEETVETRIIKLQTRERNPLRLP